MDVVSFFLFFEESGTYFTEYRVNIARKRAFLLVLSVLCIERGVVLCLWLNTSCIHHLYVLNNIKCKNIYS